MGDESVWWRDDLRLGWRVSRQRVDGMHFAERRSDKRRVEAADYDRLLLRMCAADIAKTWRDADLYDLP